MHPPSIVACRNASFVVGVSPAVPTSAARSVFLT